MRSSFSPTELFVQIFMQVLNLITINWIWQSLYSRYVHVVLCSLHRGELLLWDLSKEGKDQYQTFCMGHSRIVFNISCDVAGTKIMTVSMDRQVRWYYDDNYVIKFQTKLSECADYKWCEISHTVSINCYRAIVLVNYAKQFK